VLLDCGGIAAPLPSRATTRIAQIDDFGARNIGAHFIEMNREIGDNSAGT